jgi:ribosome biogenesis protein MAK21
LDSRINLGGDDNKDNVDEVATDGRDEIDGDFPKFKSDNKALFDDKDNVPESVDDESEEDAKNLSASQKKRKERKKLKSLPTFASAEDYAKLLDQDDDDLKV